MKVEDVMTKEVVTTRPDTALKEVAVELSERGISGVPVVGEAGEVVGVISEADVMLKEAGATRRRPGLVARLLDQTDPKDRLKLEARVVGEAMTTPPITIAPYVSVASAAAEMLERRINRLPVVKDGKLVGIVTRADLVRAFARSDRQVAADVRRQTDYFLALSDEVSKVEASVTGGDLKLTGTVRRRSNADELPRYLRKIPGIVSVTSELRWLEDDSKLRG